MLIGITATWPHCSVSDNEIVILRFSVQCFHSRNNRGGGASHYVFSGGKMCTRQENSDEAFKIQVVPKNFSVGKSLLMQRALNV